VHHAREHFAHGIGFRADGCQRISTALPLGLLRGFLCEPNAVCTRLRGCDRVPACLFGRE